MGRLKMELKKMLQILFSQNRTICTIWFNKSHAAAYALIAYQTAFLKTYYKEDFKLQRCQQN